jgi:hypothetical protein
VAIAARAPIDRTTRNVVTAYTLLSVAELVFAIVDTALARHKHPVSTVAFVSVYVFSAALLAVLLVGLVRRRRWAWVVLLAVNGFAVISYALESGRAVLLASYLVGVVLLLSPPMRRYVRRQPDREPPSQADSLAAT